MATLFYIHDPMCSWCYAFDTVLKQIESHLPCTLPLTKILGGLAADSTEPMPESMQTMIQSTWQQIENTVVNVKFNYDFWFKNQPVRSTYPSCRAVLAAKKQSAHFEDIMIQQIQWAYYKNAENPSLNETLINCANQIGLNTEEFIKDLMSQTIESELQNQIKSARRLGVSSYPSLRLQINEQVLAIKIDYLNHQCMLEQIFQST